MSDLGQFENLRIWETLKNLFFKLNIWEKNKLTVLFVTHSVTEAVYLSQRVLVMSSSPGKILDDVIVTEKKSRDDSQNHEFFLKINHLTNILKKESDE